MTSRDERNLEGKLEAIKELKAEYGIGSQQAYNYMKVFNSFSELRDRVLTTLRTEGVKQQITNREVSNLCTGIGCLTTTVLSLLSEGRGLEENKLSTGHYVKHYGPSFFLKEDEGISWQDVSWSFNYERFLVEFYKINKLESHEKAFGQTFANFFRGDFSCLRDERGEYYSFKDILSDDKFLITPTEERHPEETCRFVVKELEQFYSWISGESLSPPYEQVIKSPEDITLEEETYLFGGRDNLYERALKDRTLGDIWVERRIALNRILTWENAEHTTPNEKIYEIVEEIRLSLDNQAKRIKRLESINTPKIVMEAEKRMIERRQYMVRAINQNRKWLEKILGN